MDEFQRPKSGANPLVKTKTADKNAQPYRRAVIAATDASTSAVAAMPKRRAPKLDMSLPEGDSPGRHHRPLKLKTGMRRARLIALRTALIAMALLIGVGGLLFSQGFLNLHRVFKGTAQSAASLQQDVNPNLLKGEGDGRINVLLVGIGGQGHDGGDLTDTLMLASIDPVNHQASLLSVPRDLWINLPGKGNMKINAAYEVGKYAYLHKQTLDNSDQQAIQAGFTSIDQTLETVLGVPISYNVLVNFQSFRQAVDTVGGVDVNVPTDLYDPTMAWENNNNPYLARAGNQTFDGVHALMYARSRETSSDYARGERQRAVLLALKQKAVTGGVLANPSKLSGLMGAFGSNIQTDLSIGDASRLYSIFKQVDNSSIQSISLAGNAGATASAAGSDSLVTSGTINGQSVVMPKAGLGNYAAIQNYVRGQLQDGYIKKENAKILVLNGSGINGLSTREAATLKSYGYNVIGNGNAPSGGYLSTKVVDLSHGKDKYTRHYLEQRFGVKAVTKLPDAAIMPQSADFVVLLSGDAATQ